MVAGIVYLVATYRYSPSRAKEILIKMFTWLTGVLSAFFLLVTLYALLESNEAVLDLSVSFLATTLIGLTITRICNAVFLKRHPDYRHKPMKTTREARFPWSDPAADLPQRQEQKEVSGCLPFGRLQRSHARGR